MGRLSNFDWRMQAGTGLREPPKVTFQSSSSVAGAVQSSSRDKKKDGAGKALAAKMRDSTTNLIEWYHHRCDEDVSTFAAELIDKWPTKPSQLGNFLASLDKLRVQGETSPQVIAKASQKLNHILDEIELQPGATTGNTEHKLGTKEVRQVQWSPNGEKFACASFDGYVRIFDVLTDSIEHTLAHDADEVRCLQWSLDGDMLATGGADCYARIFDTSTGEEVAAYEHGDTVRDVQWCPLGSRLATASFDHSAVIIETQTDKEIKLAHEDKVRYVRWDPDGKKLATASNMHLTRIFDGYTGIELLQIPHENMLEYLAWSMDGTKLATSAHDRAVCIFDPVSGEQEQKLPHGDVVRWLAWCPLNLRLATACRDKYTRVFDMSGTLEVKWSHHGKVRFLQWSPDGEQLAATSDDGFARVFNVFTQTEQARWKHQASVECVDWSPRAHLIATAACDSYVRLFNVSRGAEEVKLAHDDVVRHIQWNPDGQSVATASFDCNVRVFRIPSGNIMHKFHLKDKVRDVKWSPDGRRLASCADSDAVQIFNMESGREECRWQHPGGVPNIQWSPDGTLLASACFDKYARIFNVATREEMHSIGHPSSVLHAHWSADGHMLATLALRDKCARIFDAISGLEVCSCMHDDWVLALEWNPATTHLLATSADDKKVRIIDSRNANELASWTHEEVVRIIRWSPSGNEMATAAWTSAAEHFVSVFDVTSGALKFRLEHFDKIQGIEWSINGDMLSTSCSDKNARIFDMWSGDEVARWEHEDVVRDAMWSPNGQWLGTASSDKTSRIFNAQFAVRVSMHFNRAISSRRQQRRNSLDRVGRIGSNGKRITKSKSKVYHINSTSSSGNASPNSSILEASGFEQVIRLPYGAGRLPLQRVMVNDQSAEFGQFDLTGMHLIFDNGGYTLPPHWSMNLSTLHLALYTAIMKEQEHDSHDGGSLGLVLDRLLKCGAKDALFYSDLFGLNVLDLALRLRQPAVALDVLVPEVLEQMKQEPLQTYRSGFDISLGRVIGALTIRGEATALTRITLPQILEASCFEAEPETFGVFGRKSPPRLACKASGLCTCGSEMPWADDSQFPKLLPWGKGLNVPMVLEVVMLGDVLSPKSHFFEGLCTVPQEDEHELFTHRAVRAFVHYKWNTSAKYRFYTLCIIYLCFLGSFVIWTSLPKDKHPNFAWACKIATVAFLVPIAGVELRQFWISRIKHFADIWNQLTAVCIGLVITSVFFEDDLLNDNVQPFASIFVWINCLYYLRGFHITGPYIRTLGAIISDLRGFLVVFFILQFGFAHAMYLSNTDRERGDSHDSLLDVDASDGTPFILVALQKTYIIGVLGEVNQLDYYKPVRYILFMGLTLTMTIVMLNTLIAAISETFDRLQEHSESSWIKGRAELIHEMELVFGLQVPPAYVIFSKTKHLNTSRSSDEDSSSKIAMIKRTIGEEVQRSEAAAQSHRNQLASQVDDVDQKLRRLEEAIGQIAKASRDPAERESAYHSFSPGQIAKASRDAERESAVIPRIQSKANVPPLHRSSITRASVATTSAPEPSTPIPMRQVSKSTFSNISSLGRKTTLTFRERDSVEKLKISI